MAQDGMSLLPGIKKLIAGKGYAPNAIRALPTANVSSAVIPAQGITGIVCSQTWSGEHGGARYGRRSGVP